MDKYSKSYNSLKYKQGGNNNRINKPGFFSRIFTKSDKNIFRQVSSKTILNSTYILNKKPLYAKNKSEKNWKKIILLSILSLTIISWISLLIYLPYFKINEIEIYGTYTINHEEIREHITNKYFNRKLFPKNNYFLIKTNSIKKELIGKYPIENITITKIFPYKLNIDIQEKICSIIYFNGQQYALMDKNGHILKIIITPKNNSNNVLDVNNNSLLDINTTTTINNNINIESESTSSITSNQINISQNEKPEHKSIIPQYGKFNLEYPDMPIFYDQRHLIIEVNQQDVIPDYIIDFILNWNAYNNDENIAGEAKYYYSDNINAGVTVVTNRQWNVLTQPRNSLEQQLTNLKTLISSKTVHPSEYIDLRFGERIFWK